MKIVRFKGGLGNQLFQYVIYRLIRENTNELVKADFSYYKDINDDKVRIPRIKKLDVDIDICSEDEINEICLLKKKGNPLSLSYKSKIFIEKLLNKKYYFENDRSYRDYNKIVNFEYFDGYWQSNKYLDQLQFNLREDLKPNFKISYNSQRLMDKVRNENSVFIGIRRGDYLKTKKDRKHYGQFSIEYYKNAIEIIKNKIQDPVFYIFSNDIEWVKKNMDFNCKVIYRENDEQFNDIEELFIMASCRNAIIVNSTYYWWAAWLIDNIDKIIVAPKKWFADNSKIDIVPQSWIKI